MSIDARRARLRTSRPAPASTTTASASCEATSAWRTLRRRRPSVPERVSDRSGDERSNRSATSDGATPNRITVAAVTSEPVSSGVPASTIRSVRGRPLGARRINASSRTRANTTPSRPPPAASRMLSANRCRNEIHRRRADRAANRQLAHTPGGTQQEQIADVGAREHEEQHDGRRKREQRGARLARHHVVERVDLRADRICAEVARLLGIALEEREKILTRRLGRRVRREARDDVDAAVLRGDPVFDAARIVEPRRCDADDRHRPGHLRRDEVAADHRRVAAKAAPPGPVAEDDRHSAVPRVRAPGHLVARAEQSAQHRVRAEDREEVVGHDGLAQHEPSIAVGERVGKNAPVGQAPPRCGACAFRGEGGGAVTA